MKVKKMLALFLALAMVLSLAACSSSSDSTEDTSAATTEDAATEDTSAAEETSAAEGTETEAADTTVSDIDYSDLNVGIFWYAFSDTFLSTVRSVLDETLDEAGITYTDYDGNSSQTTQNESITTALTNGCNLLLVNLVESGSEDAAQKIIEEAAEYGVSVYFFNRTIEADGNEGALLNAYDNVAFLGTDAPEAGHMQGQMIGEYLVENYDAVDLNGDGVISYAMFKGQEGNAEAIYRTQYAVEDANTILTEAGYAELEYFDANNSDCYQVDTNGAWSASAATEYMQTNLSQYSEANGNMIELVICNNDDMASGAVQALQAAGYNNGEGTTTIPVFGVDATDTAKELIANGYMVGTISQSNTGYAYALKFLVDQAVSGATPVEAVAALAADTSEYTYTLADGIDSKVYMAYSAYTGE
ncbi:MAG: galactose ABC transporter substrate-binding protein [Lachnospiraceae bacterium]|nr:galactose ABC transporter substrate-binding protein [Lachnospiraceae bacterium]